MPSFPVLFLVLLLRDLFLLAPSRSRLAWIPRRIHGSGGCSCILFFLFFFSSILPGRESDHGNRHRGVLEETLGGGGGGGQESVNRGFSTTSFLSHFFFVYPPPAFFLRRLAWENKQEGVAAWRWLRFWGGGLGITCMMIWRFFYGDRGWDGNLSGWWMGGWVTCIMNHGVWVGRYPFFFVFAFEGWGGRWRGVCFVVTTVP